MATISTRYTCIVCGERVTLRRDLTLKQHGYARTASVHKTPCKGSGWYSLEYSAAQLAEILATAGHAVIDATLARNRAVLGPEAADRLYAAADALID